MRCRNQFAPLPFHVTQMTPPRRLRGWMAGTTENDKVKAALSEVRSLVLGTQILLGFQYRVAFEPRFDHLPPGATALQAVALVLLVVSITCMIAPAPFHRLVEGGHATVRMHAYTRGMAAAALVPFALALGLNVFIALTLQFATGPAAFLGAASALAAALCWFAPILARHDPPPAEKDEMTPLKDRISELITETRIILPGVQALLGFQFAAYLMDGFEKLTPAARAVNTASLLLLVAAMILLMTPAPYHRLAEHGENTERVERVVARLILGALPPLALGIAGDVYVVITLVSHQAALAAGIAAACAFLMAAIWFGVPLAARKARR